MLISSIVSSVNCQKRIMSFESKFSDIVERLLKSWSFKEKLFPSNYIKLIFFR